MLPLVKKDEICICMKGPNIEEEIKEAENAINILGGKIEKINFDGVTRRNAKKYSYNKKNKKYA